MDALCKFAALTVAALVVLCVGCATNRSDIPANAQLVAEGNEKLTYQVPSDGTIYIYDDRANRLIYTAEVRRGQTLSINTREDSILIDDRRATEWDLDPLNRLQVFFNDQPRVGRRVIIEEERREIRQ